MHIVSASHDNTAWIWNTATGECEAAIKGHTSVSSLPDGVFIHTDFNGNIDVSLEPSFLYICKDTIFHTTNFQKIWVPPPFCNPESISYHKSKICLGYGLGEVLLLELQC
ncbi:hypothetical protein BYT27DRAFT_7175716 [Phlegmacium glaucopus]|nr:hypothetical protein BYT27DRAFT_7175716 [Phlegmacium glaucopus]